MRNVVGNILPLRLHGGIRDELSVLHQDISNIHFEPFATMHSPRVELLITTQEDESSTFNMRIRGDLNVVIEQGRNLTFGRATMRFDDNDPEIMTLRGSVIGIYEDVFGMNNILDLVTSSFTTYVSPLGELRDYNISGIGALGSDCYNSQRYFDVLTQQANRTEPNQAYTYSPDDEVLTNFINTDHCIIGDVYMDVGEDPALNQVRGSFGFESVQQFMSVLYDAMPEDLLPAITQDISFTGHELSFSTDFTSVHPPEGTMREVHFTGVMELYGINCFSIIRSGLDDNIANLTLMLPDFGLGAGNVQFLNAEVIADLLNVGEDEDLNEAVNAYNPGSTVGAENNTISVDMEVGRLQHSRVTLDANIMLFEIIHRVSAQISDEEISFGVVGNPFRGPFNANVAVRVTPEENLRTEHNSEVAININMDDAIDQLTTHMNQRVGNWTRLIVDTYNGMNSRQAYLQNQLDDAKSNSYPVESCAQFSRCVDAPSLQCHNLQTERVCAETKQV